MRKTRVDQDPVIFRKHEGEVIAFVLRAPANYGRIVCFDATSGHGEASMSFFHDTEPASPAEYAGLLKTMQAIGYNVVVRQRLTYADSLYAWDKPQLYSISADGGETWTEQWLTAREAEAEVKQNHIVRRAIYEVSAG